MMMKTLFIDPARCIQCCNCQNACKDEHCDNDWSPIAAPQGAGQFWIQVRERQSGAGSRMRLERLPVPCQHCASPACAAACPQAAIKTRPDGIVLIDAALCDGCGACLEACPYGAVYLNASAGIAQKCTLCAHLLDAGWDRPRCVAACPVDALSYLDEADLSEDKLYAPLEQLLPEAGCGPRVAYVNLPKPFVAGAAYSPNEDRCLENVSVKLEGAANGQTYHTKTDFLGEFRIKDVACGIYALHLEKDSYAPKRIARLDVHDGVNVEEIRLYPTQ
jgi:Fe-S-cluster-containing dehydrogenase component